MIPAIACLVLSSCKYHIPDSPDSPIESFIYTVNGDTVVPDLIVATLFNDYLYIETMTYSDPYYCDIVIHLNEAAPVELDMANYSSLYLNYFSSDVAGASGTITEFTFVDGLASGAFNALIANEDGEFIAISGTFKNVKYSNATYQPFGELSYFDDGILYKNHYVDQYEFNEANQTVTMWGIVPEFSMRIRNIPLTPGFYWMELGEFIENEGLSITLDYQNGYYSYDEVLNTSSCEVISYDASSGELIFEFKASVRNDYDEIKELTGGYAKMYVSAE